MKLPDKPSELIRLALKDLAKVEKSPKYTVDMEIYHTPMYDVCVVCFAGAVMANTLKVPFDKYVRPWRFEHIITCKLLALNCFRIGRISWGLSYLNISHEGHIEVPITPYSESPRKFKSDMRKMVRIFEGLGL